MKTLIIYFSWSNNTKNLVEELNKKFNFDVIRLERKTPYSNDYNTCAYVEAKDEWENRIHPEIKELGVDVNKYDAILLFFPIWWYTIPMPVGSLIEKLEGYKGKIILFENSYTNDAKYAETSMKDVKEINKNLNVLQGLFNKSVKEHIEFIENLK